MTPAIQNIITLLQINGYGAAKVRAIAELFCGRSFDSPHSLLDFVNTCIKNKKVPRVSKSLDLIDLQEAWLAADKIIKRSEVAGISAISFIDEDYPKNLLSTVNEEGKIDIPLVLYYKGDIKVAGRKGIAIIGTREPTKEGIEAGEFYGKEFAKKGYNIVSGLAIGCDSAGHRGAIAGGGVTTAILAHGLDTIYPAENTKFANDILDNGGLLLSEYPIGEIVNRYNLVNRDRLQSALADATLVIQTGIVGGTMHAVNCTLQAHKPLYAVGYKSLHTEKTKGNEAMIADGRAQKLSSDNWESVFSEKQNNTIEEPQSEGTAIQLTFEF